MKPLVIVSDKKRGTGVENDESRPSVLGEKKPSVYTVGGRDGIN